MILSEKDRWGIHITLQNMRHASDSRSMWNDGCMVVCNGRMWLDNEKYYPDDLIRHNKSLISWLIWEDLISEENSQELTQEIFYTISKKGLKVVDYEGFEEYYQQKLIDTADEKERKKLELDLGKSNLEANKRNGRYLVYNILLALLNLIFFMYSVLK